MHNASRSFYPSSLGDNVHFLKISLRSVFGSVFQKLVRVLRGAEAKTQQNAADQGTVFYFLMLWEYKCISQALTDEFFSSVLFLYTRASEQKRQNSLSKRWKVTKKAAFPPQRGSCQEERQRDGEIQLLLVSSALSVLVQPGSWTRTRTIWMG